MKLFNEESEEGRKEMNKIQAESKRIAAIVEKLVLKQLHDGLRFAIQIEGVRSRIQSVRSGVIKKTDNGENHEYVEHNNK